MSKPSKKTVIDEDKMCLRIKPNLKVISKIV